MGRVINGYVKRILAQTTQEGVASQVAEYLGSKSDQSPSNLHKKASQLEAKIPSVGIFGEGLQDGRALVGLARTTPPAYSPTTASALTPPTPQQTSGDEKAAYRAPAAPVSNPFVGNGEGSSSAAISNLSNVRPRQVNADDYPKFRNLSPAEQAVALKKLPGREYTVAVDRSSSMNREDVDDTGSGIKSPRFRAIGERAVSLAESAHEYDGDGGIGVYEYGSDVKFYPDSDPEKVAGIFRNKAAAGQTDMLGMFNHYFGRVLQEWRSGHGKQETLINFTDGLHELGHYRDDNLDAVFKVLKDFAVNIKRAGASDEDIAVSIIIVGAPRDAAGRLTTVGKVLEKWRNIDDRLKHDPQLRNYDIFDVKSYEGILKHQVTDTELFVDAIID